MQLTKLIPMCGLSLIGMTATFGLSAEARDCVGYSANCGPVDEQGVYWRNVLAHKIMTAPCERYVLKFAPNYREVVVMERDFKEDGAAIVHLDHVLSYEVPRPISETRATVQLRQACERYNPGFFARSLSKSLKLTPDKWLEKNVSQESIDWHLAQFPAEIARVMVPAIAQSRFALSERERIIKVAGNLNAESSKIVAQSPGDGDQCLKALKEKTDTYTRLLSAAAQSTVDALNVCADRYNGASQPQNGRPGVAVDPNGRGTAGR